MKPETADAIEQVADESGAADHRARGDRRAGIGEGELEEPECQEGHAGALHRLPARPAGRTSGHADEPVAVAEHEGEAESVEEQPAEARIDDALHQHVDRFARAAESGFEHREADLHSEHQERRDQRPDGVDRVDDVVAFEKRVSREYPGAEQARIDEAGRGHKQGDAGQFPDQQKRTVAAPFGIAHPAA